MSDEHEELDVLFREKILAKESFMRSQTTILETGNHIGQQGNGRLRRDCAKRFVRLVQDAIGGKNPFTAMSFFEHTEFSTWLEEFPDFANRGVGLGDLTLAKEWERLCELHPRRRVYIWTKDGDLESYDRGV